MAGSAAVVFEVSPAPAQVAQPLLVGTMGQAALKGSTLELTDVRGEAGSESPINVVLPAAPPVTLTPAEPPRPATPQQPVVDRQADLQKDQAVDRPVYARWWFWSLAALVTAGGVTAALILSKSSAAPMSCDPMVTGVTW